MYISLQQQKWMMVDWKIILLKLFTRNPGKELNDSADNTPIIIIFPSLSFLSA